MQYLLGCTYNAELETVQLSVEASVVGQEAEQRPADGKKGRKGKKKGKTAAVQQADLSGSTSPKLAFVMDPSKGELQASCLGSEQTLCTGRLIVSSCLGPKCPDLAQPHVCFCYGRQLADLHNTDCI